MKEKPVVSQKMWITEERRWSRREHNEKLIPVIVTKVGVKYFYIIRDGWTREIKFNLENWNECTGGCVSRMAIYETEGEYFDKVELSSLIQSIRDRMMYPAGLTLEALRSINAIIKGNDAVKP